MVLSLASSWGRALSRSFLPDRSRATAWWLDVPTSTPMKTSTVSCSGIIVLPSFEHGFQRVGRRWLVLQLHGSASTLWPILTVVPRLRPSPVSYFPGAYLSDPGDNTPGPLKTGARINAGADRPATPILDQLGATKKVAGENPALLRYEDNTERVRPVISSMSDAEIAPTASQHSAFAVTIASGAAGPD